MKRMIFITALLAGAMLTTNAQPKDGGRNHANAEMGKKCMIPNLTDEQQTKIQTLRTEHMKAMTFFKAEMDELRAQKHKLMLIEKPDTKAIDGVIEKMGSKHVEMQKASTAHHLAIRGLLTDEQKVMFDAKGMRKGKGMGMGHGQKSGNNCEGHGRQERHGENCPQK